MSQSMLIVPLTDKHPKTLMTNFHWDVVFTIAQCIFCMASNDAEGMTVLN